VTIPSFTTYQPPGTYVQDVSTAIVVPTLVPSQVLTLVGPALGYRTAVQSLLISAGTPVVLTYMGVYTTAQPGPPPVSAPVVTTLTGTVLTPGVDYDLSTVADPSGNPGLAVTSITRVNTSTNVSDGQQVSVTYNYADATYFQPQVFTDPQSVINAYGQPFLTTVPPGANASQVANPLSAAAQVAFANGATTLLCVALNPASGNLEEQFEAAYSAVATQSAATIVVPVFTDDLSVNSGTVSELCQTLAQTMDSAMWSAYNDGFPRQGFFGFPRNYSEADEPIPTFAGNLASRRTILAYPEIVMLYNNSTGQAFQASGCYLAVALGAILSSLPIDTGLTNQTIKGFSGLTQTERASMTNAFMNTLAASGVSVCFINYAGALVCRQGLTTDMSALNYQEISMVRQSDSLLVAVQQGLQGSGLIGQPITNNTITAVQEALLGVLEAAVTNSVIQSYTNVSVTQQTYPGGSPTVITVTFNYLPALPLNYITVQMSIDLSTGLVATQSNQNASSTGSSSLTQEVRSSGDHPGTGRRFRLHRPVLQFPAHRVLRGLGRLRAEGFLGRRPALSVHSAHRGRAPGRDRHLTRDLRRHDHDHDPRAVVPAGLVAARGPGRHVEHGRYLQRPGRQPELRHCQHGDQAAGHRELARELARQGLPERHGS